MRFARFSVGTTVSHCPAFSFDADAGTCKLATSLNATPAATGTVNGSSGCYWYNKVMNIANAQGAVRTAWADTITGGTYNGLSIGDNTADSSLNAKMIAQVNA